MVIQTEINDLYDAEKAGSLEGQNPLKMYDVQDVEAGQPDRPAPEPERLSHVGEIAITSHIDHNGHVVAGERSKR